MILVPMTVEALIVNRFGNSREYADIAVNYELLNGVSLLGGVIEPQPLRKRRARGRRPSAFYSAGRADPGHGDGKWL